MLKTAKFSLMCLPLAVLILGCQSGARDVAVTPGETAPEPDPVTERVSNDIVLSEGDGNPLIIRNPVLLGIERERDLGWPLLRDKRLTLITDATALTSTGHHSIELIARSPKCSLMHVVLVGDEASDTVAVSDALAKYPSVTISRLTQESFLLPIDQIIEDDAVVFDLALDGTRFGLGELVLGTALEVASIHFKEFIVLDRPTKASVGAAKGPFPTVIESRTRAYFQPSPVFHGMTAGEFASLYNSVFGISAQLYVQPMSGWRRSDGNDWLMARESWRQLTDKEEANRRELLEHPTMDKKRLLLDATQKLLRPSDWVSHRFLETTDGFTLVLEPAHVPPITIMERLTEEDRRPGVSLHPVFEGTETATASVLGVTVLSIDNLRPVELALHLTMAAQPQPPDLLDGEGSAFLLNDDLYEGLKRDLTPDQLRRLWENQPVFKRFQEDREQFLLYEQ